jgi:hypothetical protein
MTTFGGGIGYQDWERIVSQVSSPLIEGQFEFTSAVLNLGVFNITGYPTLRIQFAPLPGPVDRFLFQASFYADQALSIEVGTFTWHTEQHRTIFDSIAVLGPWVEIIATDLDYVGGEVVNINVVATTADPIASRISTSKIIGTNILPSYPPGPTNEITSFVTTGPAMFTADCETTQAWTVLLQARESGSAFMTLIALSGVSQYAGIPILVNLPEYVTEVLIQNPGTSGIPVTWSLISP